MASPLKPLITIEALALFINNSAYVGKPLYDRIGGDNPPEKAAWLAALWPNITQVARCEVKQIITKVVDAAEAAVDEQRAQKAEAPTESALDVQVGGSHYKGFRIQPAEFCIVNNLNGAVMGVLKYILREKSDREEDLRKAGHFLDMLMEIPHEVPSPKKLVISAKTFNYMNKLSGPTAGIVGCLCRGNYERAMDLLSDLYEEAAC